MTGRNVMAASRRFGWILIAAGAVVLVIGTGGAWLIIHRSLQPLHDIGAAAKRIAAGDLSERINIKNTRSELGGLAQVLNSTFSRLEAAFSDQKNFTADASHELRTPVAIIIMETQRALGRERSAAQYRASLESCHAAAQDMRKLAESLLELARLDSGQEVMRRQPCDFGVLARATCDSVRALIDEKRVRLTIDCQPAPLHADPARLQQVIMNLLQNAIRYNRDGGEIRVSTSVNPTHAVLRVADTGVGISAVDLPHVFERFDRGDKARARAHGGSGLGLSICKSIVDAHSGTISIESKPGEGTTFVVCIPN